VLLVGVLLIAFGICDLVVATVLARKQADATGGLGAETPAASRILRFTGVLTVAAGAVLAVIGLAS
jgi:hypothetical protein